MNHIEIKTTRGIRKIGQGQPTFVVAELSANHLQDYDRAVKLIHAAAEAGADAVKLQTYTADTMTIDSDKKWFVVGGKDNPKDWQGQTLYQLYEKASTPWDWHPRLQKLAEDLGLVFFSTPFDGSAVDFLEGLNVPIYKIASYEVTDIPLLKKIGRTQKPVLMSVGFATLEEIELAVQTLHYSGAGQIAILHCLTSYGTAPQNHEANLANIRDLGLRFSSVVGFSDNNAGIELPLAAVRASALIIEKHLTLSRAEGGPDAQFSLEPSEMAEMIRQIRSTQDQPVQEVEGPVHYGPANEKEEYNKRFRRSIFAATDIKQGETLTSKNIRVIRPSFGLSPKYYEEILGQRASEDIAQATPLAWKLISKWKK